MEEFPVCAMTRPWPEQRRRRRLPMPLQDRSTDLTGGVIASLSNGGIFTWPDGYKSGRSRSYFYSRGLNADNRRFVTIRMRQGLAKCPRQARN